MRATKNDRSGFSVIELVVIVSILVVLGLVGYLFVNRQSELTASKEAETSQTQGSKGNKEQPSSRAQTTQIKRDLGAVDIDKTLDTSEIDQALQ